MKILPNYIARNFLTTLVAALLVLNFVMSVGLLFKVMQYFARGMSLALVWDFLRVGIPGTLSYSIPISILVSSLLVFGRLSTDSEISAMRASGISVWQIMRAPLLISALLASICLHINTDISPQGTYVRVGMRGKLKITDVTALIEPGRFAEIGAHSVFVGSIRDGFITDLRIREDSKGFVREINAATAFLSQTNDMVVLDMYNVTFDPALGPGDGVASCDYLHYPLASFGGGDGRDDNEAERLRRPKDRFSWMLARDIVVAREHPPTSQKGIEDLGRARVAFSIRIAFALSCICFAWIGIPLGMKHHRRDSSVGTALCLALAGFLYLVGIFAESLAKRPQFHAHWFLWLPVIVCFVTGVVYARRNN